MEYTTVTLSGTVSDTLALNTPRTVSLSGDSTPEGAVVYRIDQYVYTSGYGTDHTIRMVSGPIDNTYSHTYESSELSGSWVNFYSTVKSPSAPGYGTVYTSDQFPSITISSDKNLYIKNGSASGKTMAAAVMLSYFMPASPTAPDTLTFSKTRPLPSNEVTVSISGMEAGELNVFSRFELYRATSQSGTYTRIYSGITSQTTVTPNQTYGASYWYKAKVIAKDWNGAEHESELSPAFELKTADRGAPTAPTSVLIDGRAASSGISSTAGVAGSTHTLSWSGAAAGQCYPVGSYEVWRSTSQTGTYTRLLSGQTGTSAEVTASTTQGQEYWYKVKAVGRDDTTKVSDLSTAVAKLTTLVITAPTAPTSVTVDNKTSLSAKAGTDHIVRWSGAKAGTNNAITRYKIYSSAAKSTGYEELGSVKAAASTFRVYAADTDGQSLYYKVQAVGTYTDSALSTAVAQMTSYVVRQSTAPGNVRISSSIVGPGVSVTISWNRSTAGANAVISGYKVYRSTDPATGYAPLAKENDADTLTYTVISSSTEGQTFYYKVQAICTDSDGDSELSEYVTLTTNQRPTAPVVQSGDTTLAARPRILLTLGTDPEGELMRVTASGYTASRAEGVESGGQVVLRKTDAMSTGEATVTITITDPHDGSASTEHTITYEPVEWTDPEVIAGTTPIKAAHITEMQDALDEVRAYYAMEPTTWTPCEAGQTQLLLWYTHVSEIIASIREIADKVNDWDQVSGVNDISLGRLEATYVPTAALIMQLRGIIINL